MGNLVVHEAASWSGMNGANIGPGVDRALIAGRGLWMKRADGPDPSHGLWRRDSAGDLWIPDESMHDGGVTLRHCGASEGINCLSAWNTWVKYHREVSLQENPVGGGNISIRTGRGHFQVASVLKLGLFRTRIIWECVVSPFGNYDGFLFDHSPGVGGSDPLLQGIGSDVDILNFTLDCQHQSRGWYGSSVYLSSYRNPTILRPRGTAWHVAMGQENTFYDLQVYNGRSRIRDFQKNWWAKNWDQEETYSEESVVKIHPGVWSPGSYAKNDVRCDREDTPLSGRWSVPDGGTVVSGAPGGGSQPNALEELVPYVSWVRIGGVDRMVGDIISSSEFHLKPAHPAQGSHSNAKIERRDFWVYRSLVDGNDVAPANDTNGERWERVGSFEHYECVIPHLDRNPYDTLVNNTSYQPDSPALPGSASIAQGSTQINTSGVNPTEHISKGADNKFPAIALYIGGQRYCFEIVSRTSNKINVRTPAQVDITGAQMKLTNGFWRLTDVYEPCMKFGADKFGQSIAQTTFYTPNFRQCCYQTMIEVNSAVGTERPTGIALINPQFHGIGDQIVRAMDASPPKLDKSGNPVKFWLPRGGTFIHVRGAGALSFESDGGQIRTANMAHSTVIRLGDMNPAIPFSFNRSKMSSRISSNAERSVGLSVMPSVTSLGQFEFFLDRDVIFHNQVSPNTWIADPSGFSRYHFRGTLSMASGETSKTLTIDPPMARQISTGMVFVTPKGGASDPFWVTDAGRSQVTITRAAGAGAAAYDVYVELRPKLMDRNW